MSNIINTQNSNIKNTQVKIKSFSRFNEAPDYLPKYSVNEVLKEKDEFRKTIKLENKEEAKQEKRKSTIKKILAIIGLAGLFIFWESKK